MIIVMAATPFEVDALSAQLSRPRRVVIGKCSALKGRLRSVPVLVFISGVGKTNAAHGTTALLEQFRPDLFLLTGCGGAYQRSGLVVGDLALASEEIFGDEGVITPHGWRSMKYLRLPLLRKTERIYYNRFPMDHKIVARAKKILRAFCPKTGKFVTVSQVTGTQRRAEEMQKRFGAICENMEGAPVAQLCALYDIPFLEIRGISNIVKQRDKREWNLSAAARISQEGAKEIILHWGKTP